ncbi:hypothetical protein [Methylorubrum podarium]|jgi:hypothetical protein|uniref:hypothetical protein n=1 Tax=Methylorubrum podarium TaxID=200476 RepID=UPI001EE1D145|nr:hypothetical protein [Methylorubrum podarium]GJE69513.1 hypothetical protein CHKEEEPN_1041 [Methylorubrum podarium]
MSESSTRRSRFAFAALALMAGGLFGGSSANAAPLAPAPATTLTSEASVETVQWQHHHFGHRHHPRHWGHRHHHHGHWGHHRRHWGHHHRHWGHHHGWRHRHHHHW